MKQPLVIKGGSHTDIRGTIFFNNDFDASEVKRIYMISNSSTKYIRAWQGHKVERRWFTAANGAFRIKLIKIDNWDKPTKDLEQYSFVISEGELNVLTVPSGYVSSIQAIEENSKLLVMADYMLGEIKDEYRFEPKYFSEENNKK